MQRAVARRQARKIAVPAPYGSVDEKAFRKGHAYHTIVCDLERRPVDFVAGGRTTDSLAAYYAALTTAQRDGLQAVAMDIWPAYIRATTEGLPGGAEKIVFDRFHIMRAVTDAVDRVRKAGHHACLRTGKASPLTRTKYTPTLFLGLIKENGTVELRVKILGALPFEAFRDQIERLVTEGQQAQR